jgi:hypothetical protein
MELVAIRIVKFLLSALWYVVKGGVRLHQQQPRGLASPLPGRCRLLGGGGLWTRFESVRKVSLTSGLTMVE